MQGDPHRPRGHDPGDGGAAVTPEALAQARSAVKCCLELSNTDEHIFTDEPGDGLACQHCIARALTEQVRATKRQIERLDKEKEQLWAAVQQWQEDALGKSHEIAALRAALAPLLDIPDDDDEALVALRDRSRAAAQATQGGA